MMDINSLFLVALFAPILITPAFFIYRTTLKENIGYLALIFPILSALIVTKLGAASLWGKQPFTISYQWIPSLNLNFSFLIDGLSLFFGLVVTVMGAFVCFYSRHYLHENELNTSRFYTYLMIFMSAMFGAVFSNNILLLFIFWELTSISSFFLIGFNYTTKEGQTGSLMALLVTAGTGLVLLIGLILLHLITGETELSSLLSMNISSPYLNAAFILIMIGAFGKSAQFPFHFWLPNAMSAPTPVSAYLHSAAMVKLGVFLTARFYPILIQSELWQPVLITVGITTMVLGAVLSLLTTDLKGILAYTTVSQLGFLIGFYGLGSAAGVEYDLFHTLNHVLYKGTLFMVAGIIIHSVGTKNITKIGGLFKKLPLTGIAAIIASLGMAGIPFTSGFLSKELMLAQLFDTAAANGGLYTYLPYLMLISATCLVATGLRLIINPFFLKAPSNDTAHTHFHNPGILIQLPPFILSLGVILLGVSPQLIEAMSRHLAVPFLHTASFHHLALFHGLSPELMISIAAMVGGTLLYTIAQSQKWAASIPLFLQFDTLFLKLLDGIRYIATKVSQLTSVDKPLRYLPIILTFMFGLFYMEITQLWGISLIDTYTQLLNVELFRNLFLLDEVDPLGFTTAVLIIVFTFGIIISKKSISKLLSLSILGFLVSFYFVLYKAPDLALTQMMVEVVSLVFILLLLSRVSNTSPTEKKDTVNIPTHVGKIALAIFSGSVMFLILGVLTDQSYIHPMGRYFIDKTVPLAEGSNAVNTILVDFRGFDTMGEISVLTIALLGIIGLLYDHYRKESR